MKKQSLFSPIELLIILIILLWLLISAYPSYEARSKKPIWRWLKRTLKQVRGTLRKNCAAFEQNNRKLPAVPSPTRACAALNADGARAPGGGAVYAEMADRSWELWGSRRLAEMPPIC